VDEDLLDSIDNAARNTRRTRSEICRLALAKWLEAERIATMVREEQEAYRRQPVDPDEFDDLISAQTIHDEGNGNEP